MSDLSDRTDREPTRRSPPKRPIPDGYVERCDRAFAGKEIVKCDQCGGIIDVQWLSDTCYRLECPCGFYNDVRKGL